MKRDPFRGGAVFGLLLGLGFLPFLRAETPAGWPEGWRRAYQAFEAFLDVRRSSGWMQELEVTPEGGILTAAPGGDRLGAYLWWSGAEWAGVGFRSERAAPLQIWSQAVPGRHAVVLKIATELGYQHVSTLHWITVSSGPEDRTTLFGGEKRRIEPAAPPENPDAVWPNDRLLAWWDWQILPKHHPNDIRESNRRVTPSVFLQVDFHGAVHRRPLSDPGAERFLRWRVYCNGELVHHGPATRETRLETASFGPGNFVVLAGVEGPTGFLPVSNLLSFSLAPQRPPGLQLAFAQYDYGFPAAYPRWFRAVLPAPYGPGKTTYEDPRELSAARRLVAVWEGAADFGNEPGAKWIRKTSDLVDLRPKTKLSPDQQTLNRFDLDSDLDEDGLTLREEMEGGDGNRQRDTDGDAAN